MAFARRAQIFAATKNGAASSSSTDHGRGKGRSDVVAVRWMAL
jgi:hypothetical protein